MTHPYYYEMAPGQDIFDWLETLPDTRLPVMSRMKIEHIWLVGLRYARRCLYKGDTLLAMAEDAHKASACFARLATVLEQASHSQEESP